MLQPFPGRRLALPLLLLVWLFSASLVWGTLDTVAWQNSSTLESSDSPLLSSGDGEAEEAAGLHRSAPRALVSSYRRSHPTWCLLQPGHGSSAARAPPVALHV